MNLILIIRAELVCLLILLFITLYSRLYKMGKDQGSFLRICLYAIGHIVFDIITVITVNSPDSCPPLLNQLAHIAFYLFALLFSHEFFCYTVALCCSKKTLRKVRIGGLVLIFAYIASVPLLPLEYLSGNGTNYSFGPAAIVGYGVAMLFFVSSIIVVVYNHKKTDKYVVGALLPMLGAAIAAELIQIAIPEMLFTGGAITIITVGFFFSLENPVAVLRHKVLVDAMTGVKSRHSYDTEIVHMNKKFEDGTKYGMVFCDINDLKAVNDSRGHLEGDAYIAAIAQILLKHLKSADTIYRMGGDEFLAVYHDKSADIIRNEISAAEKACDDASREQDYHMSMAIGYALSDTSCGSLQEVLRTADYRMYSDKAEMKLRRNHLLGSTRAVNLSGLTDRVFDAFAITDTNRFLFVTNITTGITRWSRSAVEYFALDSEFIADGIGIWSERVHPEDRDFFLESITSVFNAKQKHFEVECRIKNGSGNYVLCSCIGTVLSGRSSEPDLFAGTMFVRSEQDSLDHLTDLRNSYEMMNYFNYLIRSHTPTALLKISIMNMNRINMLYGYSSGNEVLGQLARVARGIIADSGSIFRSEGSKFVICMPNMPRSGIENLYKQIKLSSEQQIRLNTFTPPLQLAAGAYMLQESFDGNGSVLRSNLIYAHSKSKYEQYGKLVFYNDRSDGEYGEYKNQILMKIHQDAIAERKGFYLVYQPIVSAETGHIVGTEALVRWADKDFGSVNPDRFVPWLEGDPCFFALGNWILRSALTEAKRMLKYRDKFRVNVNISIPQLEHEGFRAAVLDILAETGFPPDQLCLELTERCRELNTDFLRTEIEFFRSHGIRVALDDLGTGFSSFGLLLSLNVDEIKLDRTFVREIRDKKANQILTKMVIEASSSMGYETCLEGVEDDGLCLYLKNYGATCYQGYYCAKPMPIDELVSFTEKWNSSADK